MTPDQAEHSSSRRPNHGAAAIGFFLGAACWFTAAALERDRGPWFLLIGGICFANGCLLSLRARKAAVRQSVAAGHHPQAGDRG